MSSGRECFNTLVQPFTDDCSGVIVGVSGGVRGEWSELPAQLSARL